MFELVSPPCSAPREALSRGPNIALLRSVTQGIAEVVGRSSSPADYRTAFGMFPLPKLDVSAQVPHQNPLYDLYLGTPGTAVFLAASARVLGDERWRELSLRALEPTRKELRFLLATPSRDPGQPVGAFVGIFAAIYALTLSSLLLDEPALLDEAHDLTAAVTPEMVRQDSYLDVIAGSAGALLVLLALDRLRPGPNRHGSTPLELAAVCGDHLLHSITFGDAAAWGWRKLADFGSPMGFSHGASGICLALARLHARTGEPALWQAACGGAATERDRLHRWSDSWRAARGPSSEISWCHGAAGIALARLGMLESVRGLAGGQAELAQDLEVATRLLAAAPQAHLDHLCCGNLGYVDALLRLNVHHRCEALRSRAETLAVGVLRALKKRGGFALDVPPASMSLLRGLAGIGYGLLRLVAPDSLPSLLILEAIPITQRSNQAEPHAASS